MNNDLMVTSGILVATVCYVLVVECFLALISFLLFRKTFYNIFISATILIILLL